MKYEYVAVFYADADKVAFHFCDMEKVHSFGDNLDEAIVAAQEVLSDELWSMEQAGLVPPAATPLELVEVKALQVAKKISADTEKYAMELTVQNVREAIEQADNPIRELLNRRHLKISQLAEMLGAPYRTIQDQAAGKSKPPKWVLKLILDKILG